MALLALGWVAWRHTGRVGAAMAIALMPQLAGNLIWLAPINAESLLVSVVTAERARG